MTDPVPTIGKNAMVVGQTFVVPQDWIDHNGHVNLARYADAFYLGARQLSDYLEMTPEFKERTGTASFAAELCISYRREVRPGAEIFVQSQLLGFDSKRIHSWHELMMSGQAEPAATGEMLGLNIDRDARRVADMPDELVARLDALAVDQRDLSPPERLRITLSS